MDWFGESVGLGKESEEKLSRQVFDSWVWNEYCECFHSDVNGGRRIAICILVAWVRGSQQRNQPKNGRLLFLTIPREARQIE